MATVADDVLIAWNPATGLEVGRCARTSAEEVPRKVRLARQSQAEWSVLTWSQRQKFLNRWWRILGRDVESWAALIREEIGKPHVEALAGDVIPTLDSLRWTVKHAGHVLRDCRIGAGWQRWMQLPSGRLRWQPLGVVGMIGTWNYPLFLNAVPIAQALAAGNGVIWKPSELAVRTGRKIEQSLEEAGLPPGLVATVYGGAEVGQALVESEVDLGFFTGGIENGRRVLSSLAARGIPAVAELSGFDPAIILDDAPRESTIDALTWAAFVGCGQTCVAVKRVYVVGDARPWAEALARRAIGLRVGDPMRSDTDIGPMISAGARERFDRQIAVAVTAGARVLAGGRHAAGPGWFYEPTVLLAEDPAPESLLAGAFGPLMVVRGVPAVEDAVAAANASAFALGASVWSRSRRRARSVAERVHAGMVCVNEAVTPTAHAAAPFGGFKASGHGRTHGALGLREFVSSQVVFERGAGGFRPQLFPYSRGRMVESFLALYCRLFHHRG